MSFGDSEGGATAATAPVALRLRDGGGGRAPDSGGTPGSAPGTPDSVDRSSGAPALRPPGTPTGGSAVTIGGGSLGMLPSGRGTPGALGFCAGSNTSERRPVAGGGGGGGEVTGTGADCSGGRAPGGGGWTGWTPA